MKHLFAMVFCLLSASLPAFAETKISVGLPVSILEAALTTNGFYFGNEYALQMVPPSGTEYLFCRLDEEMTLIASVIVDKKVISDLLVHIPPKAPKDKGDRVFLHPFAMILSSNEFSLVFKTEANQALEHNDPRRHASCYAPVAPPGIVAHL